MPFVQALRDLLGLGAARAVTDANVASAVSEIRPELGDRRGEGWMLERIARTMRAAGEFDEATATMERALAVSAEIGDSALATAASAAQN